MPQTPPTFRSNTELVEVDVAVTDAQGRPIRGLTKDDFASYAPTWTPDGKGLVYIQRISGNMKLFQMDASGANSRLWVGGLPTAAVTDLAATPNTKIKMIDFAPLAAKMNELARTTLTTVSNAFK